MFICLLISGSHWSKDQLSKKLLSCGDIESNPGPNSVDIGLKCLQLNLCHWKQEEINHLLDIQKPDVVLLQETWLRKEDVCKVDGYHVERRDRKTARGGDNAKITGGGLVILIKDDAQSQTKFSIVQMEELELGDDNVTEVLQIKIIYRDTSIVFSDIYRIPIRPGEGEERIDRFEADNVLGKCLQSCMYSQHVICGDFNAHHAAWDNNAKEDISGEGIFNWCIDSNIDLANNGSITYMSRSDARSSSPDLTMTTTDLVVKNWSTQSPTSSDHLPITFIISIRGNGEEIRLRDKKKRTTIAWKKVDFAVFNARVRKLVQEWPANGATGVQKYEWYKKGRQNNLHQRSIRLNSCLLLASRTLPRGCRYDPVPWWHNEIDNAIEIRDLLREEAGESEENRIEWVNSCQDVVVIIKQKRLEYWKEYNNTLRYTTNPGKVAAVLNDINRESRSSTNIAIVANNGKILTGDYEKATAFRGEYAKQCKNIHTEETRSRNYRIENRKSKIEMIKYCNSPCNSPQSQSFSTAELDASFQSLKSRKSPGEDGIQNEMILNLEEDLRIELLTVINMSWKSGFSPSNWLCGVIIPIHKSGKDKILLSSYRPVCLMSAIAKLAEKLITTRLRYDLESRNILTPYQSGFRNGRSTADPLLRLVSDVQGGFNRSNGPFERTVAVLADLSRAFDKVGHQKLLLEFQKLEIPSCYAKWFRNFLSNRIYRVRYGEAVSGFCRFPNGVPQGSVSGPLLFVIFINSLSLLLSGLKQEGLQHHLIADDTTIWNTQQDIKKIALIIQKGLDVISEWSKAYFMPFNDGKNNAILFTNLASDHVNFPEIKLGNDVIIFMDNVKLLGITLGTTLSFNQHVAMLKKSINFRLSQMRKICGFSWGGNSSDCRGLYFAFIHSMLTYSSAIFSPLLNKSNMDTLQKLQNQAARIITGCTKSTKIEALLLEANIKPVKCYYDIDCIKAAETARRRPAGDPLLIMTTNALPPSNKKKTPHSWHHASQKLLEDVMGCRVGRLSSNGNPVVYSKAEREAFKYDLNNRDSKPPHLSLAPWEIGMADKIKIHTTLIAPCIATDSNEIKKKLCDDTIALRNNCKINMWTDGSVLNKKGAGAAMIYLDTLGKKWSTTVPAGNLCSSYKAEAAAIKNGLEKLIEIPANLKENNSIFIATDCQALLSALRNGPCSQQTKLASDIWRDLLYLVSENGVTEIILQWIASHCGVVRNEAVDKLAAKALDRYNKEIMQRSHGKSPIFFQSIIAEAKFQLTQLYKEKLCTNNHRFNVCGPNASDLKFSYTLSRADEVLLSRLRVGECIEMGTFRARLNIGNSSLCRWCNSYEETVIHVYSDCTSPSIIQLKRDLNFNDVSVLHKDPVLGLSFCREAIKLLND